MSSKSLETTTIPLRDRIGQYASLIGAGALVLALIGWVWQGGVTDAITLLAAIGVCGLLVWVIAVPSEARALLSGRGVRFGTMSILLTLVLIGFVTLVYIGLQRAVITLDMTLRSDFTLDDATTGVLDTLSRTVQITGFYTAQALPERERDDQIFRLYETYTDGKVKRVYYNQDEEPALASSFGVAFDGDVFVSFLTETGEVDFTSVQPVYRETNTERDLTTALKRLLAAGQYKVYFDTGYSNLDHTNEGQQGITNLLQGLEGTGIGVAPLNLVQMEQQGALIPQDASTVVITRGNVDLTQGAINILDEYLKRGGALFIATDVVFTNNPVLSQNGLLNQYLWNRYGIRSLDAAVVDALASDATQLDVIAYAAFSQLEIASRLNQEDDLTTFPLFRIIRALEVSKTPPVTNGQVLASSSQSYGETDWATLSTTGDFIWDANTDLAGPFTLAAWALDEATKAKVFVVGDTDFMLNGQISSPLGNSILVTDALGWLTNYSEQLSFGIDAQSIGLPFVFVSTQQLDIIAFITTLVMPGLVLVVGIGVWVYRNRR